MMKYIKPTFLVILLVTFQSFALESLLIASVNGSSQEYVEFDAPPLFLLKADEAAKLRDIVAGAPYDKAYKTLIANADAVLGDKPQPLEEIIYGGHVSNHPDRLNTVRHLQDMTKIYTLTWANFVSGDSKYSAKAIEFVAAWAKKCKPSGNDVNDNKLLTCMFAYQMLGKEMTKAQKKEIGKWVKSIGDAQQKGWSDKKNGNRAGKRLMLIYFAAYLDDDQDRIEWVQPKIQRIWNSTLFGTGETVDLKRRDAMHYHFSTVSAFLQIAHIGRLTGKDHYNQEADNGGSIPMSIEFALPFIKGEKIHPEWVNTIVKLDKERWAKAGDPYYKPGKPWDPWEGYKSLMLASVFDDSLHDWAEKLRQDKNKPLPWFAVLARASLAQEPKTPNTANTARWSREKANDNFSAKTPADHVNALMGTAPLTDMTLYGGANYHPDPNLIGFSGTVYPGPDVPHGMVQLSPYNNLVGTIGVDDTRYGSGYFYPDKSILGFGHTNKGHWRGGAVIMMPTVGNLQIVPGSLQDPDGGYRSRFKHANEEATAGYYSVVLDDYNIKVELSALTYTGFHRYTFPASDEANILIDLGRTHRCIPYASFQIVDNTHIQGTQEIRSGLYSFYIEFSKPFKAYGTWKDGKVKAGSKSACGTGAGAYVTYSTTAGETIEVTVTLSRNSVADAKANWRAEAKGVDFAMARVMAKQIWNDKLSMIEIEGGTPKQRENFYSTFYRSLQWPPILTDYSDDEPVYEWPSLWDTFRNKQPLLTLIEPEVKQVIVRNMVEKAKRDGRMYTHFHGNHASSIITASYLSGLDDFDIEAAYTYLKKNQTDRTITDRRHMQFLDEYLDNGYVATIDPVPAETRHKSRSAVAKTMEYAFNDGVMAILAEKLGKTEDMHAFIEGSKKYKNVYEPTTGIMWGRKPNGDFVQPVKPMEPFHTYMFREANAWQQTWFVPHDIPGLAELMGGRQACIDKLDEFFTKPYEPEGTLIDIGGMIGQYNHGNQPDHHAPYIYNYLGQPWKTQQRVREIMDKMYRGNVYTGMDDCGEMSAWYVFSAMGIYPFNPSSLVYLIGSPIFDRVTIHLPQFKYGGAKFVIEAKDVSKTNMYIQSATLNGAKYDKPWISFWEIAAGSTLVLQMGPDPSDWGSELANVPPSKPVSISNFTKKRGCF